mgnify:CR=1 FL=1
MSAEPELEDDLGDRLGTPRGMKRVLTVRTRQDTTRYAQFLAAQLVPGDVVLLEGPLGSGKTAIVQDIAAAIGESAIPNSPTFILANLYDGGRLRLIHCDLYRLADLKEFMDLGVVDYMEDSVTIVEWGSMLRARFPDHLHIEIVPLVEEEARELRLSSASDRWIKVLEAMEFGTLAVMS